MENKLYNKSVCRVKFQNSSPVTTTIIAISILTTPKSLKFLLTLTSAACPKLAAWWRIKYNSQVPPAQFITITISTPPSI